MENASRFFQITEKVFEKHQYRTPNKSVIQMKQYSAGNKVVDVVAKNGRRHRVIDFG
jgi:hypothetical protein